MKKLLLTLSLIGLAVGAYAQGQINLSNVSNDSRGGPTATTGGLFWLCSNSGGGYGLSLINTDFNVNFYGGSDANSLVLLKSFVNSGGGAALGPGTFLDLSGVPVTIPGALTSAFFRIEFWTGPTDIYRGSSPVFSNPLGNPLAQPPGIPTDFTAMPAIITGPLICIIPEPSTFALVGLGVAALLVFRRRGLC